MVNRAHHGSFDRAMIKANVSALDPGVDIYGIIGSRMARRVEEQTRAKSGCLSID